MLDGQAFEERHSEEENRGEGVKVWASAPNGIGQSGTVSCLTFLLETLSRRRQSPALDPVIHGLCICVPGASSVLSMSPVESTLHPVT